MGSYVGRICRLAESRAILVLAVALLCAGCATVRMTRLHPDYEAAWRAKVRRLVVVTHPRPEGRERLGELWSLLARRYVNQKRNFLAKKELAPGEPVGAYALCEEGLEGILWLRPDVRRVKEGVEESLEAQLLACPEGTELWAARAAGSWPSRDPQLKETSDEYVKELGAEVEPFVAPAFRILKATLDTLPDPILSEDDISEKIELGE